MNATEAQASPQSYPTRAHIRVLATTDLHAQLHPYNFLDAKPEPCGLTLLASLIEGHRDACPNVLLFDNGDTFEGCPIAELYARGDLNLPGAIHPMVGAMNALGYNAATLGNHDFNFGLAALREIVQSADFPFVLSNVWLTDAERIWHPSAVLTEEVRDDTGGSFELRIGLIGVAPPQLIEWDGVILRGAVSADPIQGKALSLAKTLREEDKADLVFLLAHSGVTDTDGTGENMAGKLAASGAFDAVIAGHSHEVHALSPDTGQSVPIVQPGAHGSHLGVIDLHLLRDGGSVHVERAIATNDAAQNSAPNPQLKAFAAPSLAATKARLSAPLGHSAIALTSHLSRIAPCALIDLVGDAQLSAAKRLIAGHPMAHLPMVSVASAMRTGGPDGKGPYTDIPAGTLELRHSFDVYGFLNRLIILRLTGAEICDWLEHSAKAFNHLTPGLDGQNAIDHSIPGYNFDVMCGLTYEFDLSQPSRAQKPDGPGRVRKLTYQGVPVKDDDTFHVVTNSYRYGGGGGFASASSADAVISTDLLIREVVANHMKSNLGSLRVQSWWRLQASIGAKVIAKTGRGAEKYAAAAHRYGLHHVDLDDEYTCFEMNL